MSPGVAVQQPLLARGHVASQRRGVHLRAPEGVSLLRDGAENWEDPPSTNQRGASDQHWLQRSDTGGDVPAEDDHDVEEEEHKKEEEEERDEEDQGVEEEHDHDGIFKCYENNAQHLAISYSITFSVE